MCLDATVKAEAQTVAVELFIAALFAREQHGDDLDDPKISKVSALVYLLQRVNVKSTLSRILALSQRVHAAPSLPNMTSTTKNTMSLRDAKVLAKASAPHIMTHGGGIVKLLAGVTRASSAAAKSRVRFFAITPRPQKRAGLPAVREPEANAARHA